MDRVTGLLRRVKRGLLGAESTETDDSEEAEPAEGTLPPLTDALVLETGDDPYLTRVGTAPLTPADIPVETGLTAKEYLEYAISSAEGRLTRRALLEHTGWPTGVVDRLLSEMEDQQRVVRVSRGRITLVCLPDAVPEWLGGGDDPGESDGGTDGLPRNLPVQ